MDSLNVDLVSYVWSLQFELAKCSIAGHELFALCTELDSVRLSRNRYLDQLATAVTTHLSTPPGPHYCYASQNQQCTSLHADVQKQNTSATYSIPPEPVWRGQQEDNVSNSTPGEEGRGEVAAHQLCSIMICSVHRLHAGCSALRNCSKFSVTALQQCHTVL